MVIWNEMQKKSEKKFRNAMREQEIDSSFYFCFLFFSINAFVLDGH